MEEYDRAGPMQISYEFKTGRYIIVVVLIVVVAVVVVVLVV